MMRTGLLVSTAVHLVILGWGLITLTASPLDASDIETLPVEFVEITDITDLDLGEESAEAAETPSPNDPTEEVAETPPQTDLAGEDDPTPPPPPPPPQESASPADAPEAEADAPPAEIPPEAIADAPSEEPPPTEEPSPPQQAAAAPPSPRIRPDRPDPPTPPAPQAPEASDVFNTAQIAALIDRTNSGSAQALSQAPASLGVATGRPDARMTESEIAALQAQVQECWVIPTGWTNPREVSVTIRFGLNQDGTVAGMPEVVEFPASQYGQVSADNAIRAVLQCGPYSLPAEKYDQWSVVQLRFRPPG